MQPQFVTTNQGAIRYFESLQDKIQKAVVGDA